MAVRRIFHIQPGTGGGTERFCVTLSEALAGRGVELAFAIRPGRAWRPEVAALGAVHEGEFLRRTPRGALDRWRLRRAIADFAPDAVLAWRAPAARLVPRGGGAVGLVRLGDYPRHARHFAGLDAVVCNNPSIERHVRGLGWRGEVPIISNFPRPASGAPVERAELDTPAGAFVVCGAGRLTRVKGFDLLIEAVARLDGAYLWLVGDGPEAENLRAQAAGLGIAGRVRFLGWREDPTPVMAAADAFVMPSRDEPLGNALLEGWGVGVPCVASLTDGPRWSATDRRDSLLVPVGDAGALEGALARLRDDAVLRARLVAGARETLAARFSPGAVVDGYLELIERVRSGRN